MFSYLYFFSEREFPSEKKFTTGINIKCKTNMLICLSNVNMNMYMNFKAKNKKNHFITKNKLKKKKYI